MVKNIGPLEREILEILWIKNESSARDICSKIEESGERRAYSTIRTIINRLVKKKIIAQRYDEKQRIFLYTPLQSKIELEKRIIHGVIEDLLSRFEKSTISYLSEELSDTKDEVKKIKNKLAEMKKND